MRGKGDTNLSENKLIPRLYTASLDCSAKKTHSCNISSDINSIKLPVVLRWEKLGFEYVHFLDMVFVCVSANTIIPKLTLSFLNTLI